MVMASGVYTTIGEAVTTPSVSVDGIPLFIDDMDGGTSQTELPLNTLKRIPNRAAFTALGTTTGNLADTLRDYYAQIDTPVAVVRSIDPVNTSGSVTPTSAQAITAINAANTFNETTEFPDNEYIAYMDIGSLSWNRQPTGANSGDPVDTDTEVAQTVAAITTAKSVIGDSGLRCELVVHRPPGVSDSVADKWETANSGTRVLSIMNYGGTAANPRLYSGVVAEFNELLSQRERGLALSPHNKEVLGLNIPLPTQSRSRINAINIERGITFKRVNGTWRWWGARYNDSGASANTFIHFFRATNFIRHGIEDGSEEFIGSTSSNIREQIQSYLESYLRAFTGRRSLLSGSSASYDEANSNPSVGLFAFNVNMDVHGVSDVISITMRGRIETTTGV